MTRKPAWLRKFRAVSAQGPAWIGVAQNRGGERRHRIPAGHTGKTRVPGSDYAVGTIGQG
jgi:hypothetical protein